METRRLIHALIFALVLFTACGSKTSKQKKTGTHNKEVIQQKVVLPQFSADSAYAFISKQLTFGSRVPNTEAHKKCGDFLISELERFGAKVYVQEASLKGFEHQWEARNIIGEINPEVKDRILLCAHWDSRYTADRETDREKQSQPIMGASDGASGVGILLEIARILQLQPANIGVDIVFFDVEDQGTPSYKRNNSDEVYWCLGSQFWSKNPHKPNYSARYGILLDMVGAHNATFRRELFSEKFANHIVDKVWNEAMDAGYSSFFPHQKGGMITDDHYFVNTIAGIPTIDIIQYDYSTNSGFGHYWHTHDDNLSIINTKTLKAVGQVVTNVIFKESAH